jgi:predicted O-methyltransferase YrrM
LRRFSSALATASRVEAAGAPESQLRPPTLLECRRAHLGWTISLAAAGTVAILVPVPLAPRGNRTRSYYESGVVLAALAVLLPVAACRSPSRNEAPRPDEAPAAAATGAPNAGPYRQRYEFTQDWFSERLPVWHRHVLPLRGRPLRYLEIGVFEGRSALWMLENVLTHPESRLTAIDVFSGELEARWRRNLERSGAAEKVTTIVGPSQVELRKLPLESYDVIYIDGAHTAAAVLADGVLAWQVLKDGGLLIFDDYGWSGYPGPNERSTPDELRPKAAIDGFVTAFRNSMDLVHRDFQLLVRKKSNPCGYAEGCSPVGRATYLWWTRELRDPGGKPMPLSAEETDLLERWLRSSAPGQVKPKPDPALLAQPAWQALARQLKPHGASLDD